ncbi:hypothetical protein BT69DRAFT_1293151 [Atractiella rhizophila]|nr:hypothetical protein BT69DRAFT_1293151 [Atractiella rhizophila]
MDTIDPSLPSFASFLPNPAPPPPGTEQISLPLIGWEDWWAEEQTKRAWKIQTVRDDRRDPNRARKERSKKAREEKAAMNAKESDKYSPYPTDRQLGGAKKRYDWTRNYVCTRSGVPRGRKSKPSSSQEAATSEQELKVGCKARLVVHKLHGQEMLQITKYDVHSGHDPDADMKEMWGALGGSAARAGGSGEGGPIPGSLGQIPISTVDHAPSAANQRIESFSHAQALAHPHVHNRAQQEELSLQMETDIPVDGHEPDMESYLDPYLAEPPAGNDPDWRLTREVLVDHLKAVGESVRSVSEWDAEKISTEDLRDIVNRAEGLRRMLGV